MSTKNDWCRYCGRMRSIHCMNTRDMEDSNDDICKGALLDVGGGEYTVNQHEAQLRRANQ